MKTMWRASEARPVGRKEDALPKEAQKGGVSRRYFLARSAGVALSTGPLGARRFAPSRHRLVLMLCTVRCGAEALSADGC